MKRLNLTLLMAVTALLSAPSASRADTPDNKLICDLPASNSGSDVHPNVGFGLGDILSQPVGRIAGLETSVEPSLDLSWDWGEEVTNLTPSPARAGRTLVFEDESAKGYRVVDFKTVEGGLGGGLAFAFGNSTNLATSTFASVGILPIVGKKMVSERYYPNRSELDDRGDVPKIGEAFDALDDLHPRDTITYVTSGGIVFWAGLGYGFVGIDAAAMAVGEFQVHIQKVDADHAYVQITDGKLRSLGLQAGTLLSQISVSTFRRYAKGLGFLVNVKTKSGRDAFHDLVRGNLAPVQKIAAAAGKDGAVQFWDDSRDARIGNSLRFYVGVPELLEFSWDQSRYYDVSRRKYFSCDRQVESVYGAYVQASEGSGFNVGQKFTKTFFGASYAVKTAEGNAIARGFFGELEWSHRGQNVLPETFRSALRRLKSETGFGAEVALTVGDDITDRLDFTSISLRAQFKAEHARNLVGFGRKFSRDQLLREARNLADRVGSDAGTCDNSSETGCQLQSSNLESGVDAMLSSIQGIDLAMNKKDERAATQAFARFGEAMFRSPALFQLGLRMAGSDLPVDFVVEGADFNAFVSTMKTTGEGKLVPESRARIHSGMNGVGSGDLIVTPL